MGVIQPPSNNIKNEGRQAGQSQILKSTICPRASERGGRYYGHIRQEARPQCPRPSYRSLRIPQSLNDFGFENRPNYPQLDRLSSSPNGQNCRFAFFAQDELRPPFELQSQWLGSISPRSRRFRQPRVGMHPLPWEDRSPPIQGYNPPMRLPLFWLAADDDPTTEVPRGSLLMSQEFLSGGRSSSYRLIGTAAGGMRMSEAAPPPPSPRRRSYQQPESVWNCGERLQNANLAEPPFASGSPLLSPREHYAAKRLLSFGTPSSKDGGIPLSSQSFALSKNRRNETSSSQIQVDGIPPSPALIPSFISSGRDLDLEARRIISNVSQASVDTDSPDLSNAYSISSAADWIDASTRHTTSPSTTDWGDFIFGAHKAGGSAANSRPNCCTERSDLPECFAGLTAFDNVGVSDRAKCGRGPPRFSLSSAAPRRRPERRLSDWPISEGPESGPDLCAPSASRELGAVAFSQSASTDKSMERQSRSPPRLRPAILQIKQAQSDDCGSSPLSNQYVASERTFVPEIHHGFREATPMSESNNRLWGLREPTPQDVSRTPPREVVPRTTPVAPRLRVVKQKSNPALPGAKSGLPDQREGSAHSSRSQPSLFPWHAGSGVWPEGSSGTASAEWSSNLPQDSKFPPILNNYFPSSEMRYPPRWKP